MHFLSRLRSRLRRDAKLLELRAQRALARRPIVRDYGWIRLPFVGDGDRQEILYHLHGHDWHRNERDQLEGVLRPGDTVVDVGANMGFMTALFCELIGPGGRVFAFEPSKPVFEKLERVIALNGLSNVEAVNRGCGDASATGTLHQISRSSGHGSLVVPSSESEAGPTEEIELVRLDAFVAARGIRVDFVKIDTEGYEATVLRGAQEMLARDKPTLYIELAQEYEASSREAVRMLTELGYRFTTEPDLERAHNGDNFLAVHPDRARP